jgi:hypothetical protein
MIILQSMKIQIVLNISFYDNLILLGFYKKYCQKIRDLDKINIKLLIKDIFLINFFESIFQDTLLFAFLQVNWVFLHNFTDQFLLNNPSIIKYLK